jgi:hypothetical protein
MLQFLPYMQNIPIIVVDALNRVIDHLLDQRAQPRLQDKDGLDVAIISNFHDRTPFFCLGLQAARRDRLGVIGLA